MKIKKILMYLVFAFVMFIPFSVNAEVRTENFQLLHNKDFSANTVNHLKEVIYYHGSKNMDITYDEFYSRFPILIDFNENDRVFEVYLTTLSNNTARTISITEQGVRFIIGSAIDSSRWYGYKIMRFNVDDLSYISTTETSSGRTYFDILAKSNYVCIGDFYNNCGNTSLEEIGSRSSAFWIKHNLKASGSGVYIYENFNDLYVYSSIVWTNYTFTWSDGIVFDSLKNYSGYEYKAFTYNLDTDSTYSDKYNTTKTILLDASLYDKYELNFEVIDNHYKCNSISVGRYCLDKEFGDIYKIDIYNKTVTNIKSYISADNKTWEHNSTVKISSDSDKYSFIDVNWNGKYGKYVFDLSGVDDYILITISYNKDFLKFRTPELQLSIDDMTSLDMTGKYAVGLIPKNMNSPVPLFYQGNFATYYGLDDMNKGYEYKLLKSKDDFSKHVIDFTDYLYSKPIFYILNLDYKTENLSTIKYYSNYFDVIYFENDYELVTFNDVVYNPPSTNVDIQTGEATSSDKGIDFSLTSMFKKLPDLISGLGSAFTAIGECIVIAFSSLPEMVQSVLYLSLIITLILIAIKLIK